ncbi:MAG: hypothetical protein KDB61_14795, partial [Planctomycetes bacterium]|nr:hypothetical protein [Planctomycetota bacterium]
PRSAAYAPLTPEAAKKTTWRSWQSSVKNHLYQAGALVLWQSVEYKLTSEPGESREAFDARVDQAAKDARDEKIAKTEDRYAPKLDRARERVRKAEQKVSEQEDQYDAVRTGTLARVGGLLFSLFQKKRSRSEMAAAARAASRAKKEKSDIHRAESDLDQRMAELADLEKELERDLETIRREFEDRESDVEETPITPRKSDIHFSTFALLWTPSSR